jgi:hypothetical protein
VLRYEVQKDVDVIWIFPPVLEIVIPVEEVQVKKRDSFLKQFQFSFPGMRFGLMQTKVGLVSLLSKYQFSVSEKTTVPLVIDTKPFVLTSAGGMWLQIKQRPE